MPDKSASLYLKNCIDHLKVIRKRISSIQTADDFVKTDDGKTLLDAISMRLQAIGENIKKVEKINPSLLEKHPEVEWQKIIRFRDIISHHYNMLDYEIIFTICKKDLPALKKAISDLL